MAWRAVGAENLAKMAGEPAWRRFFYHRAGMATMPRVREGHHRADINNIAS